ncbi:hypothetical protein F4814DRAFT_429915 [Daldinia grandis]|nr:hypothetical protein F4814DRAFT_429915 [Daldinia grandis]
MAMWDARVRLCDVQASSLCGWVAAGDAARCAPVGATLGTLGASSYVRGDPSRLPLRRGRSTYVARNVPESFHVCLSAARLCLDRGGKAKFACRMPGRWMRTAEMCNRRTVLYRLQFLYARKNYALDIWGMLSSRGIQEMSGGVGVSSSVGLHYSCVWKLCRGRGRGHGLCCVLVFFC